MSSSAIAASADSIPWSESGVIIEQILDRYEIAV